MKSDKRKRVGFRSSLVTEMKGIHWSLATALVSGSLTFSSCQCGESECTEEHRQRVLDTSDDFICSAYLLCPHNGLRATAQTTRANPKHNLR